MSSLHASPTTSRNQPLPPLVDRFGRVHQSIRISVTDRCNIRCRYCMPEGQVSFLHESRYLSFDHLVLLVKTLVDLGITKLRLTGGEPLMRRDLSQLIRDLRSNAPDLELALTTNGMFLPAQAQSLADAGLQRINISLDTLREATFKKLSRRDGIDQVLAGIDAACQAGLDVRLNALLLRSINWNEVEELLVFAIDRSLKLRFIEFMPLDAERQWSRDEMISGNELRQRIAEKWGDLHPKPRKDPSQPAEDYHFANGLGEVGFIDSVSHPFCHACNRLRLTAEGFLHNCLFGKESWDIGNLLRQGASQNQLVDRIRDCVWHKHPAHGISESGFSPPPRAMYQIGG